MIDIHFHWSWLLIAAVLIIAIIIAWPFLNSDDRGPAAGLGCLVGGVIILVALLAAAVIGGIFIW